MRVRFGMADTAREIDIEVDDAKALIKNFEKALESDEKVLWVTEEDGRRYGLVTEMIVYVDVEPEKTRSGVGFST